MKFLFVLINFLVFATNLSAINFYNSLADTLEIKSINYNNSTIDSTVWINIDYPQILGFKNSSVESSVNKFLAEEFKQSVDWYEEMKADPSLYEDISYEMQYSFETGFQIEYNSGKFISHCFKSLRIYGWCARKLFCNRV